MKPRNLIFGQKMIAKVAIAILPASIAFGCMKPPEGGIPKDMPKNPFISYLQESADCKLPDGFVRFRGKDGKTFVVRNGQEISQPPFKVKVTIESVDLLTSIRFDDLNSKIPSAFTKVQDCQ